MDKKAQTKYIDLIEFRSDQEKSSNCPAFLPFFQVSRGFLVQRFDPHRSHLGGTIGIPRTKGICLPEALAVHLRCTMTKKHLSASGAKDVSFRERVLSNAGKMHGKLN